MVERVEAGRLLMDNRSDTLCLLSAHTDMGEGGLLAHGHNALVRLAG
jgi:hypothetical protein